MNKTGPRRTGIDITAWYERYGAMVFRRCRSILGRTEEALDAMQDVFVEVLRRQGRLRGDYPSSFLYTVATNLCLNRLRSRREMPVEPAVLETVPGSDDSVSRFEAGETIRAIFADENRTTRLMAWLYHVDGLTLDQVSRTTGFSISGVRKRLLGLANRAGRILKGEDS